ncbi:MAG: NUDIX domain-containing protein [Epsilonproteobacteria bacterium]|nr:NUDIX domain-containing protein [Campylobacterota bacterium]
MQDGIEWVDLVDQNDCVVKQVCRNQAMLDGLKYIRAINVFIINQQGKLWIPRRAKTKRFYPGCLDVGVGGCVQAGETYDQACKRELQEEIGDSWKNKHIRSVVKLSPVNNPVSSFMHVYEMLVPTGFEISYPSEEFTEHFWLTPYEVIDRVARGDGAKSDLLHLIKIVYKI